VVGGGKVRSIEIKTLIGLHTLSAVEEGYIKDNGNDDWRKLQDRNYLSFILDGKKYTAIEDLNDGYRSCMDRLIVDKGTLKNIIPDTKVVVVFEKGSNTLLCFYSTENGKIVMEVGTNNDDRYYPSFVGYFYPENLPANNHNLRGKGGIQ
jgi:hypothetical protein